MKAMLLFETAVFSKFRTLKARLVTASILRGTHRDACNDSGAERYQSSSCARSIAFWGGGGRK